MSSLSELDITKIATAIGAAIKKEHIKNLCSELLSKNIFSLRQNPILKQYCQEKNTQFPIDMRLFLLVMLANQIAEDSVDGEIAELGVYRGDFAQKIRPLFPGRKFYLFDTFEGFVIEQSDYDKKQFGSKCHDFSVTNVDMVLKNIADTDLCIVKKGFFPDSAKDVDDTFAFVSLDVDLYEPTLAGLNFFYDRLAPNGYILVHDFGNNNYPGCGKAVKKFCLEKQIGYIPMPDSAISAVITKGHPKKIKREIPLKK